MRRFRRSERGLSEIVGTLMLVVIVVTAATLLAAFVASYQKQLQTEETFSHDQSLESIEVLGLTTKVGGGVFTSFNFTLASEYVNPSGVLDVSINGAPLVDFFWESVTNHTNGTYNVGNPNGLTIQPFDQVIISLCLALVCKTPAGNADYNFSFLGPSDVPVPNHFIKFDVFTHLHNDFTRVFLPPTPLAVASELNPSGNNPITLLDGSTSFQPGTNASIVNWAWSVDGIGHESASTDLASATFTESGTPVANGAFLTGTVDGTAAVANFTIPPGFTYGLANFTLGNNLTISGTGTCTPLTDSFFQPQPGGQTESLSGTTLAVTFSFKVTIPPGCSGARLGLLPAGVALNVTGTASGEEYEISPALGPLDPPALYVVTLVVTNSDGLDGTLPITYEPPA